MSNITACLLTQGDGEEAGKGKRLERVKVRKFPG